MGSAAPPLRLCQVCHQNVALHSRRTHISRHIVLVVCARDVCSYCGCHDCNTELLRNTHGRRVSSIAKNYVLGPTNVHYGAMMRTCARNPCTNRPMHCVLWEIQLGSIAWPTILS